MSSSICRKFVRFPAFKQSFQQPLAFFSTSRSHREPSKTSQISLGHIDNGVHSWEQIKVGIVGAPFHLGQPHQGVEKAPFYLRETGIIDRLIELGHDVKDYGDVDHDAVKENLEEWKDLPVHSCSPQNTIGYMKKLSEQVTSIISDDRLCLTIGGDHSIGWATIFGHLKAHPDACVLWVDAHADINTPLISNTGHFHGMPLSFNMKEMSHLQPKMPDMDWFEPLLESHRVAYIGLREVDPLERTILDRLGISAYSMREVDELGVRECVRRALRDINPVKKRPLHISFDIDALDPLEAPSTGTPVRGGLTLREGMSILEDCFNTGNLRALDLVEVNVNLGNYSDGTKTLTAAKSLILSAMGYYRGGRPPLPQYLEGHKGKIPEKTSKN